MKVKWKCLWNVVKWYLLAIGGAILVCLGIIFIVIRYIESLPIPELNETELYVSQQSMITQGCGCGISLGSFIPFLLILIGTIGIIWIFYSDIKPCIIWEGK